VFSGIHEKHELLHHQLKSHKSQYKPSQTMKRSFLSFLSMLKGKSKKQNSYTVKTKSYVFNSATKCTNNKRTTYLPEKCKRYTFLYRKTNKLTHFLFQFPDESNYYIQRCLAGPEASFILVCKYTYIIIIIQFYTFS
jgi:hypothetical protein